MTVNVPGNFASLISGLRSDSLIHRHFLDWTVLAEKLYEIAREFEKSGIDSRVSETVFLIWWLRLAAQKRHLTQANVSACIEQYSRLVSSIGTRIDGLVDEHLGTMPVGKDDFSARNQPRRLANFALGDSPADFLRQAGQCDRHLPAFIAAIVSGRFAYAAAESAVLYSWSVRAAINRSWCRSRLDALRLCWERVPAIADTQLDALLGELARIRA